MLTQLPEEEEEVPEPQLSFVFGNSAVRPQTPHILPEDAQPKELTEYYSSETLCLSRTELKHVADSILKNSTLKHLYLEGNQICSLPDSMFTSLPSLLWLDLRNNQITSLPAEIGLHRSLKTLLLEGNPISELPPELGNVISLKGLNLRNCPISFPPHDIVRQGLQCILQYLRSAMAKRPVSMRKTPPGERHLNFEQRSSKDLPVVEKLQLSALVATSVEEQDESVDEDDLQRFRELKHKMMLLDKAELGSIAQGDGNPKSCLLPITKRKKATTKASIIPELRLFDTQQWKRPEERRQAAMKELKEKQAILDQRKKSQEALRKWRIQAKGTQDKKMLENNQKKQERQRKREEAETDLEPNVGDSSEGPPRQMSSMSITECEETRSARRLERQIRAHVEKMQERRRNPKGTATERIAAADQDVEELRKLQTQLLEKRRGRDVENCFTIFTGGTWPSYLGK
ncbi:leucine-rich repeat-containing protein 27-like isoform X1 [Thunnus albacares]|uniref:leucine-rich repeat-containing protein 27-like isoform X1 n=2 Tax=Thunnus albacares TaxID=8236 RepID=UPI001CF65AE3|nr:leucine-rich repeat-containing protein 27-like isoform X1 [Thunnus albacares]